jgi:hypothetical protein
MSAILPVMTISVASGDRSRRLNGFEEIKEGWTASLLFTSQGEK